MRFSRATFNSAATVADGLQSVAAQIVPADGIYDAVLGFWSLLPR